MKKFRTKRKDMTIKIKKTTDYMIASRDINIGDEYIVLETITCKFNKIGYIFTSKNNKHSLVYEHEAKVISVK